MKLKLKDIPTFTSGRLLQLLLTPDNYTQGQREALRDAFAKHLNSCNEAVKNPFSVTVKRTPTLLEISYKIEEMPPDFKLSVTSAHSLCTAQFTPARVEWNYAHGTSDTLNGVGNFAKALADATNVAYIINQLRKAPQAS